MFKRLFKWRPRFYTMNVWKASNARPVFPALMWSPGGFWVENKTRLVRTPSVHLCWLWRGCGVWLEDPEGMKAWSCEMAEFQRQLRDRYGFKDMGA